MIDERIDASTIELVARTHPDWQIVMVGPVVKISPASLPQLPNIHYFGQQSYTTLPGFLAGWDVCLMPFALNEATRFISPTKVLEYMAAERPIVSTMIADVSGPYGGIVHLARSPQHFVECCEQAVALSGDALDDIIARMREVLQHTSWDRTAQQMEALIDAELAKSTPLPLQQAGRPRTPPPINRLQGLTHRMPSPNAPKSPVLVVGAGPTGLSATYHLGKDAVLLERNGTVGGWCRSMEVDGFTFDYAGHIMFSNDPYVHDMYQMLLGDNVHWQDREAWVYSHGVYTRYPFQGSLHGLPQHVIKECIMGAIEARHGSVKSDAPPATTSDKPIRVAAPGTKGTPSTNGSPRSKHASDTNGHFNRNGNLQNRIARSLVDRDTNRGAIHTTNNGAIHGKTKNGEPRGECLTDCCADGVLESTARLIEIGENKTEAKNTPEPKNFEEFIYKVWGRGIAKHFAVPYNRKLWAVPLAEMETSWLGGRVPLPDLEEIIDGALAPVAKPMGPNARFGYPLRGGFQALMDGFLPHLQDQLRLNCGVAAVSPSRQEVTLTDGTVMSFDYLISTMPLPLLIRSMGQEAPAEVQAAVAKLRYVSVRCVHLGIGRAGLTEKHWIYYPEDSVFHRIFVQGNASPHCNPPGGHDGPTGGLRGRDKARARVMGRRGMYGQSN